MNETDSVPDALDTPAYVWLWRSYGIVLLIVGTVGNGLTFLVFCKERVTFCERSSTYFIALAIADFVSLYTHLVPRIWEQGFGQNVTSASSWTCKFVWFTGYTSGDIPVWILVSLTVDRTLKVFGHRKWSPRNGKKSAIIVILIIVFASACINSHLLYGRVRIVKDGKMDCYYRESPAYTYFVDHIWFWLDVAKYSFVPSLILIFCNIRLIRMIRRRKSSLLVISASNGVTRTPTATMMLIAVSFQLLMTTSPIVIALSLFRYRPIRTIVGHHMPMLMACLSLLTLSNNALNFFTYCLSARRFRSKLRHILKLSTDRKRPAFEMVPRTTTPPDCAQQEVGASQSQEDSNQMCIQQSALNSRGVM